MQNPASLPLTSEHEGQRFTVVSLVLGARPPAGTPAWAAQVQ
jgi:hypothetical protein